MYGDVMGPVMAIRHPDGSVFRFSRPFQVGRAVECDVQVDDHHVSRRHLLVSCADGRWSFTDLQSSNGVYLNGVRTASGPIGEGLTLHLGGTDGPPVTLRLERPMAPAVTRAREDDDDRPGETVVVRSAEERYFGKASPDDNAGPRTMMIRAAFQKVQKRQKQQYMYMLGALALVVLVAAGYAWYVHQQLARQREQAADFFYRIKETDVRIARAEQAMAASGKPIDPALRRDYLARRRESEASYEKFLTGLKVYGRNLTEQEKLILKVTRTFGECELIAPDGYLREVDAYIQGWLRTKRFSNAVNRARERGYARHIVQQFMDQGLPPEFFYLAMQESDFNAHATGPPTRFGYAKGMWQFIPGTGKDYGLKIGPLQRSASYDSADERYHWEKATTAAARYIKTIYATDAQASGLLVMASYNWGERRVVDLIKGMPDNPRDRNFWKLLEQHRRRIPKQTYDYVFSIVSAAAIGENPRLFGFDFDNPLADALQGRSADAAAVTRRGVPGVDVSAWR